MEEWKEWEVFFKQELEKKLAILQKNCLVVPGSGTSHPVWKAVF